ncbi:hypothetical protein [Microbacterium gorillae]|uniref:hypothetical protein n=1 Tax=Microbacterium gorillae TaxID=1231063 RepID=UPI0005914B12|nr:hypothetical protein [Microbacterium gorillae]
MSGPDELYPPAQYGAGWLAVAFTIILVVIVAWLVIALLTRPLRRLESFDDPEVPLAPGDVIIRMRAEYLAQIDAVERAWHAGGMTAHDANLELSRLTRGYVNEYSGLEAPVLALDDLVRLGVHPALIDAVQRHYYPSVFRRGPAVDPVAGAAAARQVVNAWH